MCASADFRDEMDSSEGFLLASDPVFVIDWVGTITRFEDKSMTVLLNGSAFCPTLSFFLPNSSALRACTR